MPIDEWVRETYHSPGWIESALDDIDQYHQFPKDYRYTGPDVRDMPPEETQRHLDRAARYIETVRPHMLRYYDPETDSMQQGEKWRWSRVKTAVPRWDYTELATHIFQEALGRGMDLNQAADYTMEQLTFEESMSREEMSHFIAPIVDKLLQFYKRLEEKDERGEIGDDSPYDVQWDDMIPDLPGLHLPNPRQGALIPDYEYGHRERWQSGERAFFEYHCNQAHDSEHAQWWYRSHQPVTILGLTTEEPDDDWTFEDRSEAGEPNVYR
jgi:hypothetical protein